MGTLVEWRAGHSWCVIRLEPLGDHRHCSASWHDSMRMARALAALDCDAFAVIVLDEFVIRKG